MDASMTALTRTINKIGEAFEAYKEANDERLKAIEDGDTGKAAELAQKLTRIEADLNKFNRLKNEIETEMKIQKDRIEELESRSDRPGKTVQDKIANEHKEAFITWLRNRGADPKSEQKMLELQRQAAEQAAKERKAIVIGTNEQGGFAVPEQIAREIERLELKFSPVRNLVKVVQVGTSDYKELVNERGTESGWVGETDTRTETATPTFRQRVPTHGELYAYPVVSEWSLDDMFFNVEQWLSEEVAEAFALNEGAAVISGNGLDKPTGMLNTPPVATDDFASPLRDPDAFEYIESPTSQSPGVPEISPDALIDLVYSLNSRYRVAATWIMNSLTTGAVRKLKDANGQYLWQPGLQAGEPDRLLGYPVSTWEQMDDIGADAFPIGFGNWRRAYVLVDRVGLRITRDQVTKPGFVKFYVRRREGGTILNNQAAKFLKTTVA